MANLLPDDRVIIAKHPLDTSLDRLREPLRKIESYKPGSLSFDGAADSSDYEPQEAISKLLLSLMGHKVAYNLRSKISDSNIATELSKLFGFVQSGRHNYGHYRALSRLVIKQASDVEIWNAVFDLITTVFRTTPPTSIPPSFDGTPITRSSSSFQGSEQTRRIVESALFYEIKGCTYRDVGGFFEKYFDGRCWSHKSKSIYNAMTKQYKGGRWTDFPSQPDEDAVWDWLSRFQDKYLSDSRGVLHTTESTSDLTGGEAQRQLDIFVKRRGIETSGKHDWKDVRVIGELKRSKWPFKKILLQLARYIRDVWTAQPTRRFIHGFFLHGTTMELWVFDRSGCYSSGEFDINKEPERFIRAIAGYAMMSDEELGLDTFVEWDREDRFITITEDETGQEKRLQLEQDPIVVQRAIVCRGTNCYRSKDSKFVCKLSWVSDKRRPEADLLRLANERGVKGLAKLLGHRRITSIAEMREGLKFGEPYAFRNTTLSPTSSFSKPQSLLSQSLSHLSGLGTTVEPPKKRRSGDVKASPSKRSRSNTQSPNKVGRKNEVNSQTTSLYTHNDSPFENRELRCLVIEPAGRALRDFGSILELLKALRDAIKALKSLYMKGKILHRDISENNIIITDPQEAYGLTGWLIDVDLGKEIGTGKSGARHRTGTVEFMPIQVLQLIDPTYRHDAESMLYTLLWICARRAWEREFQCSYYDRPRESVLTRWYTGSFKDIAQSKLGGMHIDGFEYILDEFPPAFDCVKPLCRKVRGILFPLLEDGALFTGTPSEPPEKLYDPIIEAFEDAIEDNKEYR